MNMLANQIWGHHARPYESETLGIKPRNQVVTIGLDHKEKLDWMPSKMETMNAHERKFLPLHITIYFHS